MAAKPKKGGDMVVFHVWQSLNYKPRIIISFLLILAGFVIQAVIYYRLDVNLLLVFLAGAPFILAGNVLVMVKGYDNRVDFSRLDPTAQWETVERGKLKKIRDLDKAIGKWDRGLLDITNWRGFLVLLALLIALILLLILATGVIRLLVLNATILLLPQWFTGTTRVLRLPKLLVKVEMMDDLLSSVAPAISDWELQVLMLLRGKDRKVPDDIKFRLTFPGQDERFLGLYGQVVTNDVQGSSYPYFYTVIVAKKGFGLDGVMKGMPPVDGLTVETGGEGEVEFIVVRQHTTKTSGYHTDLPAAVNVFAAGLAAARAVAQSAPKPA